MCHHNKSKAERQQINFRYYDAEHIGISLDETTTTSDLFDVINSFVNDIDPVSYKIDHETSLTHIPSLLTLTTEFFKTLRI